MVNEALEGRDRAGVLHHLAALARPRHGKGATATGRVPDAPEEDVLAYMAFATRHRAKLHSTDPIERLDGEIQRRTDVAGLSPAEASIRRLARAIRMGQTGEWIVQRGRYLAQEGRQI